MTEDDTFERLQKLPIKDILHLLQVRRRTGVGVIALRAYKHELLRDNGYTLDELTTCMKEMIANGEDVLR